MHTRKAVAVVAAGLLTAAVWAPASLAANTDAAPQSAVWVGKSLTFVYRESTTRYSCDGLQQRMKTLLLDLGARSDLDVRGYGCTRLVGPDPFAGVRIKLNVLEPASGQSQHAVPARWQTVSLPPEHDPLWQAADCELLQQFRQQVLPLFATRDVQGSTICEPRAIVPGSTSLKAQVLVPDRAGGAAAAAAR